MVRQAQGPSGAFLLGGDGRVIEDEIIVPLRSSTKRRSISNRQFGHLGRDEQIDAYQVIFLLFRILIHCVFCVKG
jgi:hypothetical protein